MCGAVVLCLEHRTLTRDNPGSNPLAAVTKLGQFRSLHIASSLTCINEYHLQTEARGGPSVVHSQSRLFEACGIN